MRFSPTQLGFRAAFTLLELMVVLTLIAILSAAIIPEMRGSFEDTVLRSSARRVIDLLSLANSRAISLSQTQRVRFDRSSGRFVVEAQSSRSVRSSAFVPVPELTGDSGALDQRVTVEVRPAEAVGAAAMVGALAGVVGETISFYPDGTADAAEVRLRDRAGFGLALRVNPVTARVRVVERLPR